MVYIAKITVVVCMGEIMQKVVSIVSFIIWLIYYYFLVNREIVRKNKEEKNDFFHLFRLDSLFFLITFYIYKGFNNQSVTIYLYFIFMVSSLVYILYEIEDKYNIKENNINKEKIYYILSLLILLIPIIYYLRHKDLAFTCFITLIINFLIPIGIYITKVICKKLKK